MKTSTNTPEKEMTLNDTEIVNPLKFLSEIDNEQTISKKVKILDRILNQEPAMIKNMRAELIKKGLSANSNQDYDYVPIEIVEEALRQIFFRQVDFTIRQSYRDLNSFIVVARIRYKDPITKEYRKIDGIGAKSIQQDKGASISDFNSTMKPNGLELGVGTAYSRAIKNAAKKLGKLFGADLNRDEEIENVVVFNKKVLTLTENNTQEEATRVREFIKRAKTIPELLDIQKQLSQEMAELLKPAFETRHKELTAN